ncbi:unnamed protein product [Vitrella brassicaformis CCMP3155]|uniref:Cyclin-dependent kinase 2 homolog n=1 Tax=Vitrella brassicaformis (strain CCMP3155) TaxID=1169540 RepID=A0A0G4EJU9_VITBC|nr:unnamed protein product [Vitrella brassicaformis CCMP3155]|eukprot:CEL96790.1 unnamed protein product [Vitrella brassicaformis CCMP3155]
MSACEVDLYNDPTLYDKYDVVGELGAGSFGKVVLVWEKGKGPAGRLFAAKVQDFSTCWEGIPVEAVRDVAILTKMKHENVAKVFEAWVSGEEGRLYMVMEYASGGDLFRFLRRMFPPRKVKVDRILPPEQVKRYMFQLLLSLAHVHSHDIAHRDLKPANVLLNKSTTPGREKLLLTDLGHGRLLDSLGAPPVRHTNPTELGTPSYRAPEVVLGQRTHGTAVDIWAAGCILAEMLGCRRSPFDCPVGSDYGSLIKMIDLLGLPPHSRLRVLNLPLYNSHYLILPRIPQRSKAEVRAKLQKTLAEGENGVTITDEEFDFLYDLIRFDPAERVTAAEAVNHPYFDDLDKQEFQHWAADVGSQFIQPYTPHIEVEPVYEPPSIEAAHAQTPPPATPPPAAIAAAAVVPAPAAVQEQPQDNGRRYHMRPRRNKKRAPPGAVDGGVQHGEGGGLVMAGEAKKGRLQADKGQDGGANEVERKRKKRKVG